MTRKLLALASLLLWILVVLAWCADIRLGEPLQADESRHFSGQQLRSIGGDSHATSQGLSVSGLGKYNQALQSWQLDTPAEASAMPLLRYRVKDFPRTLELALIFRTRENPKNVHSITLPWPGMGGSTFDLSVIPEWTGQITELGFSEYPMPGQSPPDIAFPPFVLEGARLESRSATGLWHALGTRWLAWNAWSMRSINANKSAAPYRWRSAPYLAMALILGGGVLLFWLFGCLRRSTWRVVLIAVLVAWLLLDMHWLGQMQRNHALSNTLYANKAWPERSTVIADRPLQQRAELMREVLARQQAGVHVLYWTPGQADSVRLGFFLRPYNVTPLPPGLEPDAIPDGNLLLIDDQDMSWNWDGFHNRLSRGSYIIHGDLLWRQGDMLLIGVRSGARP